MAFFQNSVLNKHLKALEQKTIIISYSKFKEHFHNSATQENIRNSKEEQYQEGFLKDLFVNVLGYTQNPMPNFNLITEKPNEKNNKKADGAILINGIVKAVIELKGTETTDLGKVENQAFGYKNNQANCVYVITSNFEKLRFYIDNAVDYLEFNLFTLSEKEFELLYLCLGHENIEKDLPGKIKAESICQEDVITKKLYNDYSLFKRELFQNLVALNSGHSPVDLFKKSQKLLDRFLFLFFAEDRELLPPNSVRLVLNDWRELQERDAEIPLYARFKKYFEYLNTGYKGKRYEVFAYNGGLFKPDEILDTVKIDDELLYKHTLTLSDYDFASEVDVNILGHIFENSLNELDEIKAQLRGETLDKSKTKRKKDGVFYTPKYITKYIVENTVGKLCSEKKAELQINETDYTTDKRRQLKTKQILLEKLNHYSTWLLQLTICDPACGSGAFLNQALDFLISEHRYIDELKAKLHGVPMILSDIQKSILEKNLFGVDLNEESVEIAKLSLWLRTAQPSRKLNDLSNNIKCGNSLIDDPEIAGEKAFNWQKEFPEIFENGGFNVVIGNPPYVKARDNDDIIGRKYIESHYQTPSGMWDLYIPFIEKGILLSKNSGLCSMIIPDTIGKADYSLKLIEFIDSSYFLYQIDFFPDIFVFDNVGVKSKILFIQKKESTSSALRIKHTPAINDTVMLDSQNNEAVSQYLIENPQFELSNSGCISLGEICYVSYGMRLNSDKSDPKKFTKSDLVSEVKIEPFTEKYTEGKYIERYRIERELFLEWNTERCPRRLVRPTFPELYPPEKLLLSRQKQVATYSNAGHFCDNTIIMAIRAIELKGVVNKSIIKYYQNTGLNRELAEQNSQKYYLKYLISIINSKLITYFIKYKRKGNIDFYPDDWKEIPIKINDKENQGILCEKADEIMTFHRELQECTQRFKRTIQRKFAINEFSKKLENWHMLTYAEFIMELNKVKIKLPLAEEAEWEEYFTNESKKSSALKSRIETIDKEIDQIVYKLYGLSTDEIAIIEASE